MRTYLLCILACAAACKSSTPNDGTAIDFTLVFDATIADADVARVTKIAVAVSGTETFARTLDVAGKLTGRANGLRYKPAVASGTDTFTFDALDGGGAVIATTGPHDVPLRAGTQLITFNLGVPTTGMDGGVPMDMTCMCPDQCLTGGTLNHFTCGPGGACQPSGGGNCGLYAGCADSTTCASTCNGDGDCIATAFCDASKHCVAKVPLGGMCSAETTGDHECASPNVCTWLPNGVTAACAKVRCTGCAAINDFNWTTCDFYIAWGQDPRANCSYVNECQQNFCAGRHYDVNGNTATPSCDVGRGPGDMPRPCGSGATCTNISGEGSLTGFVCAGNTCVNATGVRCEANSAFLCSEPCNSANNACAPSSC
jgi:hypothetical protein